MKRIALTLTLLLGLAVAAHAQPRRATVAGLPGCTAANKGKIQVVVDATGATDCSTGGDAKVAVCVCDGSAWAAGIADVADLTAGAASSTDNAIARFHLTGGKTLQNSVVLVGDTGAMTGILSADIGGGYGSTGVTISDAGAISANGALTVDGASVLSGKLTTGSVVFPEYLTLAAAAGGANVSEVTITVKDGAAATIAAVHRLTVWLSDAATCQGLTSTAASGTVQAKAASGTDLAALTAKKALNVLTLATGVYVLEITDSAKTGFYVCAEVNGKANASAQLVADNYGA
jgi:hypothetical protein